MHRKLIEALYNESRRNPKTKTSFTQEQVEFICEDLFSLDKRLTETQTKLEHAEFHVRTLTLRLKEQAKALRPDTSPLGQYRDALERIANLPRCGDVRCRPLPENIARAALAGPEKEPNHG